MTCTHVQSRDGKSTGAVRGTRPCQLEGCRGVRLLVRWPDGKRTHPCTKGMIPITATLWRIG